MRIRKLAIVVVVVVIAGVYGARPMRAQGAPSQSATEVTPAAMPVHVSSGIIAGHLISQVRPVYPSDARVSGTVVLRATISTTGAVEDLQLITGPPMLAPAVMDAVRQWKYEPYLVNGKPVEVQTAVNVTVDFGGSPQSQPSISNEELSDKELFDKAAEEEKNGNDERALFLVQILVGRYPFLHDTKRMQKLSRDTQKLLQQASFKAANLQASQEYFAETGVRLKTIGHGVSAPQVIHQVDPELTNEAKLHGLVSGTVLVNLVVDEHGVPQNVHVIRMAGMGLDAEALKAVKQYRFKPAMENGAPVPVELNVEVKFEEF